MREWANPRDPWFGAFVLAIAAVVGSFAALVYVVGAGGDSDSPPFSPGGDNGDPSPTGTSEATATPTVDDVLTFAGDLPLALADFPMVPALESERPDITFGDDGEMTVSGNYFVPVASIGTGVYRVSGEELAGLLTGATASWAAVGGRDLPVVPAKAGPEGDVGQVEALAGSFEGERFASYEELFAAMTPDSGIIAFVPLDLVRPDVNALGVDGIDIVRGDGDPAAWPFATSVGISAGTDKGEEALEAVLAELESPVPVITTIRAASDSIPARCSLEKIEATGDYGAALRGEMGDYLAAADLTFTILDMSIHDVADHHRCYSHVNLSGPPEIAETFVVGGFDGVSVAANHVFDCGTAGACGAQAFLQTIEHLEAAGFEVVGGGNNLEEALAPAIFEVNGLTVGLLGFDDVAAYVLEATETEPGTAPMDDSYAEENASGEPAFFRPAEELGVERFTQTIRDLDAQVDIVVIMVETGTEDTHDPSPRSIKALRAAREAGADLIIGNQAHHAQAVEAFDNSYITYAQGNFIYDQVHSPEYYQGYVANATFHDDRLVNVEILPYEIVDMYRPTFVDGDLRVKILNDVFGATAALPPRE